MSSYHKLFSGGRGCFYFEKKQSVKKKFLDEPSSASIGDLIGTITPMGDGSYALQEANFGSARIFDSLQDAESHMSALIELRG